MRISAKARYALAATIEIATLWEQCTNITCTHISNKLGISKIFLEQCLASLKNANILISVKGQGGGYRLSKHPKDITAWEVLISIEASLHEKTEITSTNNLIEQSLSFVFCSLDMSIKNTLLSITLEDLIKIAKSTNKDQSFMINM